MDDNDSIDYAIDSLYFAASLIFEKSYISDVLSDPYTSTVSTEFYSMKCHRNCFVPLLGKPGEDNWGVRRYKCGSKCCKRTTVFWVDGNGNVQNGPYVFDEISGECGIYNNECIGTFVSNICEKDCGAP